jgi:hypothetical protein
MTSRSQACTGSRCRRACQICEIVSTPRSTRQAEDREAGRLRDVLGEAPRQDDREISAGDDPGRRQEILDAQRDPARAPPALECRVDDAAAATGDRHQRMRHGEVVVERTPLAVRRRAARHEARVALVEQAPRALALAEVERRQQGQMPVGYIRLAHVDDPLQPFAE